MRHLLLAAVFVALIGAAKPATPVAVELFTSQGCSSCPPADALVERLAKEPNIVVITRPVTYWDRLGWKDTLARGENTALQQAYDSRRIAGGGVYTPQIVVQGAAGAVGSREGEIRQLIAREKARPGPAIKGFATPDGGRRIEIGGLGAQADAVLVTLRPESIVRIGSGENGGRTVRYTNVVLAERAIGKVSGTGATLTIPGAQMAAKTGVRYALILREGNAGRIVAARFI
jgi:hypothetical protein